MDNIITGFDGVKEVKVKTTLQFGNLPVPVNPGDKVQFTLVTLTVSIGQISYPTDQETYDRLADNPCFSEAA